MCEDQDIQGTRMKDTFLGVASMIRFLLAIFVVLVTMIFISGCMSANSESDLPWNTPQPWEGSISVPGLSGN